jgi:transcription antitermination factor NusG
MHWIAARALTGKEYFVRRKIKSLAPLAEILVPRVYTKEIKDGKVRTHSERMLPGYLLIGTPDPLDRDLLKGFVKVIGSIGEEEIKEIKLKQGNKSEIMSDGMNVLVIDGPFQGCNGKILKEKEVGVSNCRILFQGIELIVDIDTKLLSSLSGKEEDNEV